jgi:serine protease
MRKIHTHRALTALAATAALAAAGLTGAPAANAARAHYGAKPLHPSSAAAAAAAASSSSALAAPRATGADTLSLQTNMKNGAVSPKPKVYLVFWGKQWSTNDPAGVAKDMQAMFKGLYGSSDTWGTILSQYCEGLKVGTTACGSSGTHVVHPSASPLAGVWFDNAANEPSNPTAAKVGAEAVKAAAHFGNKTQTPNNDAQYVVLSATGTHPDGFPGSGFCAWHDFTSSSYGNLAYTNLPYVPDLGAGACTTFTDGRLLSGIESTETHEYAETVTDFWPTDGWNNDTNGEIGDECIDLDAYVKLTTGTFDLQGLWSNSANKCVTHG